jgi:subtilisin-like proprotein convertase family protein
MNLSISKGTKSFLLRKRAIQQTRLALELLERRDLMTVYQSVDVPKAIPDRSSISSELIISDAFSQPIGDLNVNLTIEHTKNYDLAIYLRSPTGNVVALANHNGGFSDNFTNTTLDDEALTSITSGGGPFTGSFRPIGSLSDFDGQSPIGKWKLIIGDGHFREAGTLLSWSIEVISGPRIIDLVDVTPDPRNSEIEAVDVAFSDPVDLTTFDFNDIVLSRDNNPVTLNSSVSVHGSSTANVITIAGLGPFTKLAGDYTLTVIGNGIRTAQGDTFIDLARDSWNVLGSQAIDIVDVTPDPRNTAVNSVDVRFTFPIDLSTFDFNDVFLRVDGNRDIVLNNTITVEQLGTSSRYRVSGLAAFTSELNRYEIKIVGAGITDDHGFPVTGEPDDTWITQGPQVLDIVDVTPDPRNSSIDAIEVKFQFPLNLATFGINDIALTRNGVLVPLGSAIAFSQGSDTTTYRVSGLTPFTASAGDYEIKVFGSGVTDTFSHRGTGVVFDRWQVRGPTVLDIIDVVPDPRNTQVDNVEVKIQFVPDLNTFDFNDVVLKLDNRVIQLNSSVTITRIGQTDGYSISGLGPFTRVPGLYSLTVSGVGIKDPMGRSGSGVATDAWTFIGPHLTSLSGVTPYSFQNTPVNSVGVEFVFPVDISSFNFQDVTLSRNDVNVPLSSSVTVRVDSAGNYLIDGLRDFTDQEGAYVITVSDINIADHYGNRGTRSLSLHWSMDTTAPQVLDIIDITPDPRIDNFKSVKSVSVVFSEPVNISRLYSNQISLRIDGGPNLITDSVYIYRFSGNLYRINNLGSLTNASGHFELRISGPFSDLAGNIGNGTVQDDWNANNSPTINMGGALFFPEGSRPLCLTANATVSDDDTSTFAGGKLQVEILGAANANEQLAIIHRPNLVGYVGVSGNKVLYQGTEIGTFSGGQGAPLVINLNGSATHSSVTALTNSITYQRTGQILNAQSRSVLFGLSDGEGGKGYGKRDVTLFPINDPTKIQLDGPKNYVLNGLPIQLAPAATVTDLDTNLYTNGILRIGVSSGYDRTEVFGLTGSFSIANGLVLHNGTTIGATIVNNTRGRPLAIRFNQLATVALIQDLIRSVSFQTNASSSMTSREIEFSLRDGQGVYSPLAKMQVNIVT